MSIFFQIQIYRTLSILQHNALKIKGFCVSNNFLLINGVIVKLIEDILPAVQKHVILKLYTCSLSQFCFQFLNFYFYSGTPKITTDAALANDEEHHLGGQFCISCRVMNVSNKQPFFPHVYTIPSITVETVTHYTDCLQILKILNYNHRLNCHIQFLTYIIVTMAR